jgi:2-succinyl-5-enolpyruvyl-6-hydroxy-3-cyclohexene-1-carboxylate synthase
VIEAQLAKLLATAPKGCLAGPVLAREIWEHARGPLVVGSSNPIRDLDLAPVGQQTPQVYANRGLAGIDGTLSTAIGIALDKREPTILYCGDLTFFHDSTALAIPEAELRPELRIIVANDSGGSIFATLEYGQPQFESAFERVFATEQPVQIAALASAMGVRAQEVSTVAQLRAVLETGIQGIEVVVVKVDRQHRAALSRQIAELSQRV